MTSLLFRQEREVNHYSDSVHRQAVVSDSSNPQQPAPSNVMHEVSCGKLQHRVHHHVMGVAGNCNVVLMLMLSGVVGNCNGAIAQMLKNPCCLERDRKFGSVWSQEQERFLSERQNLMISLKENPGEPIKVKA